MGHFVLLNALLLGLIGGASAQMFQVSRPEYPSNPKAGCTPGRIVATSCPVRMECFVNKNFPNGGVCDCNPLWFKYPGKLPFDDSEWDDGFTTSDCEGHHISRFLAGMFFASFIVLMMAFIYTDVVVIRELKRVKALRWNASTYTLFFLVWAGVGIFLVSLMYLFNYMGLDKTEYWYLSRGVLYTYTYLPANVIIDFEICVTWIDLYDRTSKMSKSTSRAIRVLRACVRLIAFTISIGFTLFVLTGGMMSLLVSALMPLFAGLIANVIGGVLIIRTLCPDNKDIANPNWKIAEAIRRAVKHGTGAKFMEFLGLAGMISTSRHPQLGYMYGFFNVLHTGGYVLGMSGWLQYLIYGNRKHLKKFANETSSAYFGFSTIGLNKTLTTASSKMSSAGSTVSSRSSAAPAE